MHRAEEKEILAFAAQSGAVVITLDADFHALVAVRGLQRPSVIRLRKEGCRAEAMAAVIGEVLSRFAPKLAQAA